MSIIQILFCLGVVLVSKALYIDSNEFIRGRMYGGAIMERSISEAIEYAHKDPNFGGKIKIVSYHTNFFAPVQKEKIGNTKISCKKFGSGNNTLFIRSRVINEEQGVCAETLTIFRKISESSNNVIDNPCLHPPCKISSSTSETPNLCDLTSKFCPFYKIVSGRIGSDFIRPLQEKYKITCSLNKNPACFYFKIPKSEDQNDESILAFLSDIFVVLLACPNESLDNLRVSSIDHSIQFTDYDISQTNQFIFQGEMAYKYCNYHKVNGKIFSHDMKLVCDIMQLILIYNGPLSSMRSKI